MTSQSGGGYCLLCFASIPAHLVCSVPLGHVQALYARKASATWRLFVWKCNCFDIGLPVRSDRSPTAQLRTVAPYGKTFFNLRYAVRFQELQSGAVHLVQLS